MNAADLIAALRSVGLEPRPYSGRGMFGKECVGVSVDHVGELDGSGVPLSESSQDSLGLGKIIYWRHIPWPKEEA